MSSNSRMLKDPRTLPATKLGRKLDQYDLARLPDEYDDAKHGPAPYFVKYKGMVEKMIEVLEAGGTQEDAAILCGVSPDTLRQWLRRGRRMREDLEQKGPAALTSFFAYSYINLVELFETKEAEERLKLLKRIHSAGEDNWQANAWILERKHGFTTKNVVQHQHGGTDGGPIRFTLDLGDKTGSVERAMEEPVEVEDAEWEEDDEYYLTEGGDE